MLQVGWRAGETDAYAFFCCVGGGGALPPGFEVGAAGLTPSRELFKNPGATVGCAGFTACSLRGFRSLLMHSSTE